MSDGGDGRRPPLTIVPPPDPKRINRSNLTQVSPLEIIMTAARAAYEAAFEPDGSINLDRAERAARIAEPALCYVHPKLAAVVVKNTGEDEKLVQRTRAHSEDAKRLIENISKRTSQGKNRA